MSLGEAFLRERHGEPDRDYAPPAAIASTPRPPASDVLLCAGPSLPLVHWSVLRRAAGIPCGELRRHTDLAKNGGQERLQKDLEVNFSIMDVGLATLQAQLFTHHPLRTPGEAMPRGATMTTVGSTHIGMAVRSVHKSKCACHVSSGG